MSELGSRPHEEIPPAAVLPMAHGELAEAELRSLVLLSVNISHKVVKGEEGWYLHVAPADLEPARHHLAAFEEENRHWPPEVKALPVTPSPGLNWGVVTLLAGLMAFHALTGPWLANNPWFQRGAVDSRQVLGQHETWRVITGLTLHADASHLLGNVALGGLVLWFLASLTGGGGAWFLAIMTGGLGNYLNVLYRGGDHRVVGFSTAVFGVIGALCGLRMYGVRAIRSVLLPLGAGAGLLAMLGTEGQKTDVGAHLWGLGVGLVCGLLWHWLLAWRVYQSNLSQVALGVGSFMVVLASWWLALG